MSSVSTIRGAQPSLQTPVTGTFSGTGPSAAFTALGGRSVNIWLGAGTYTVQLECSPDGTNWYILTANGTQLEKFTNVPTALTEQWENGEAGLQYRLNCTAYTSGTPGYRISQ
jgi:hypothetical protein